MSKNTLLFLSGGVDNTSPLLSIGGERSQVLPRHPPAVRIQGDPELPGITILRATKDVTTYGTDTDTLRFDWDRSLSYPRIKAYRNGTPGSYDITNLPAVLVDGIYFVKFSSTYFHIQVVAAEVSATTLTSQPFVVSTEFTAHLTYPTGGVVTAQEPWYGSIGGYSMNLPSGVYLASAWGFRDSFANSYAASFGWEVSPGLTTVGIHSVVDYLGSNKSNVTKTISGAGFYCYIWDTCGVVLYIDPTFKELNNQWRGGYMHLRDTARFLPALSTADHTAGTRRNAVWYMRNCEASEISVQVTVAATGSPSAAAFVEFAAAPEIVVPGVTHNLSSSVGTATIPVGQYNGITIQLQPTGVAPYPAENVSYVVMELR